MSRRIKEGYYRATPLPSERGLSRETGLSVTCVRRVIAQLLEEGLLTRDGGDQLVPAKATHRSAKRFQVLLLSPVTGGLAAHLWQEGVSEGVKRKDGLLRIQHYLDEDDPTLLAALGMPYDLIFFIPPNRLSEVLRNRLSQCREKVFTLFRDLTDINLSFVADVNVEAINTLMDHLYDLGHRNVDCVHCHAGYKEYEERIAVWKHYLETHGMTGQIWDCSDSNEHGEQRKVTSTMRSAVQQVRTEATAFLGLSVITGWGLSRAFADASMRIPEDRSIAVFGPSEHAALWVPALTSLAQPAISEMIRRAIEVFENHGGAEVEVVQPKNVGLFIGESTRAVVD
ncbi:substrate-binding domain-containing protein [Coraliomargarita sp. W4R72]